MENMRYINSSVRVRKPINYKKMTAFIVVVAFVSLAFYFSSQPASISKLQSGSILNIFKAFGLENITMHMVRKLAHFTLFGAIGTVITVALSFKYTGFSLLRLSFEITTLLGALDEFHQMFVPGRGPQIKDVMIDASGALIGVLVISLIIYFIKKK